MRSEKPTSRFYGVVRGEGGIPIPQVECRAAEALGHSSPFNKPNKPMELISTTYQLSWRVLADGNFWLKTRRTSLYTEKLPAQILL
jgi:hypothetical protein